MDTRVIEIDNLTSKLIFAIAFCLPFAIFSFQWGEGGESKIEPAHVFAFILIAVAMWEGAKRLSFQRLATSEKAMLLCMTVVCASFISAQIYYGWPGQLIKGYKQVIGFSFVVVFFFTVRRHVNTPKTLIRTVTWIWRGCLVLAILGLWQSIALNLLNVNFLADWQWVDEVFGHTFDYWYATEDFMAGLRRVNSFASEPAGYCQYLLAALGLVVFRFFPPPFIPRATWKAHLPSLAMAVAYLVAFLLSFSLLGLIGLMIALLSHNIILKRINSLTLITILIIGMAAISALNYFTGGIFLDKTATMTQIMPDAGRETGGDYAGSALVLAMHLEVTLAGLQQNPVLGWGVGGHPEAVERELPAWIWNTDLVEANATDAASLALRLLSEMGLLGFLIFTATFALIIWQAVRAIQGAMQHPAAWEVLPICTGITVASISMVLFCLARSPSYFALVFWFVLALTSAVPEVLKQGKASGINGPPVENAGSKSL